MKYWTCLSLTICYLRIHLSHCRLVPTSCTFCLSVCTSYFCRTSCPCCTSYLCSFCLFHISFCCPDVDFCVCCGSFCPSILWTSIASGHIGWTGDCYFYIHSWRTTFYFVEVCPVLESYRLTSLTVASSHSVVLLAALHLLTSYSFRLCTKYCGQLIRFLPLQVL